MESQEVDMHAKPHGAGKSSFDLIDRDKLFAELALKKDTVVLDLGPHTYSFGFFASG